MKHTLTILAGLLLAAAAQAANYTAAAAGNWHTTNTWGVTSLPTASDNVDLNGKAVTMTGTVVCASLKDVATGGSLDFGANAHFTCRAVTNAPLTTSAAGVVLDVDYKLTTGNGFVLLGGAATISGTWRNSGTGYGVYCNNGTVPDFSGAIINSGSGVAAYNGPDGTWSQFSGSITNSGSGTAAVNEGGTWTAFAGTIELNSTATTAIDGDAIPFSGTIRIAAQPDLAAENIVTGKTILGVTGSRAAGYGINGTGLLGAGW